MTEHIPTSPQPHEQEGRPPAETLELFADSLVQDPEKSGVEVMDEFIGAVVRNNGAEAVVHMADLMHGRVSNSRDFFKQFTRTKGLRNGVTILAHHTPTSNVFDKVARDAIAHNKDGGLLLRNLDQIQGYIYGGDHDESWAAALMDEARSSLANTAEWEYNPYKGRVASDIPSVREDGLKWVETTRRAGEAGVDTSLIGRSVEALVAKEREARAMGARAAHSALPSVIK